MTGIIRAFGARLRALVLTVTCVLAATIGIAEAQGLADEVGNKTTVKLNDIPAVSKALSGVGLGGSLGNLELASVTATSDTVSGYVNFIAMRWNFLFVLDGTSSYFAMEPVTANGQPRTPKLSDFFQAPGIELTDMLTYDRVAMVVTLSPSPLKLDRNKIPPAAKAMFDSYFDNPVSPVDLELGLNFFAMADIGKVAALKSAIEAIGGKSTRVQFKAKLAVSALDNIIKKQPPKITAKFQATLPPIQPSIGGKVTLPATFTLGLIAELSQTSTKFGYVGEAEIPFAYPNIAKKRIDTARTVMALQVAMGIEGGKPVSSISATMFKGKEGAFKQAFGLPFLDLQDYTMKFSVKPDAVGIGIGASGRFYDNNIETLAAVEVPAESSGIPLPDEFKFMVVPTSPTAIGSLSLRDLTNAFADLTGAVTGASVPHAPLPDDFVRIQGTAAGQGPFIDVNTDIGLDAGLSMGGALVVWGKQIARIDVAEIHPTSGIEIKAKTEGTFPLDIIKLPQADVDINVTKDNISDPHVRIAVNSANILGSQGRFELSIDKARQVGIMDGATPFNLFKATLVLDSDTSSVEKQNFTVTGIVEGDYFTRLADGLTAATADLVKGTDSAVATMNSAVHDLSQRMAQAKIDKSTAVNNLERARASAYAEFESAKSRVDSVYRAYQSENSSCDGWPWNWGHCVAAGTLWLSYQTAKGVLSVAQKAVDGFLQGTGKALSAVVDGLNAAIAGFGQAIEATTNALGTVVQTAAKTLDIAAKLAGKALEAVAYLFDIDKLWMKGSLSILQAQQSGALGVEYTLVGKQYLTDVSWDFKIPIDKIVEVFKPGSRPDVKPMEIAKGYAFNPSTTDVARGASDVLLKKADYPRTVRPPFDPSICVSNPYAIDDQIAQIKEEQAAYELSVRNADVSKWVAAIEGSASFRTGGSPAGLNWVSASNGGVPAGAVLGGVEPGRGLYICRASYNGGIHPGKIVAGNCNIGYGGREITIPNYQVLTAPNGGQPQWRSLPGGATDIGVGANGKVWVIGSNPESQGYGIYRWDNNNWNKIPASAVRIAVDPNGVAWIVQRSGGIFWYHPNGWQQVSGGATDIGIGANGKVWVIGGNPEAGGYGIYRRDGNNWTKIPGSALRIAVDPAGNAWVINNRNDIYRFNGSTFVQVPGKARDIGIGADGSVWVIGTNSVAGGGSPYVWTGSTWMQVPGGGTDIAVAPDGSPAMINSSHTIFLSSMPLRWAGAGNGQVPQGAFAGGQEPGRTLYVCRASYNGGDHPGKIVANNCNIGWGGREVLVPYYQVMITTGGSGPNYGGLQAVYQTAKQSLAQPASQQKYIGQATILAQLATELAKLPPGGARNEVQAAMSQRSSAPPPQNPDALRDERNQLDLLLHQLETLRSNPASPCGQAIREANAPVQPTTRSVAAAAATAVPASQVRGAAAPTALGKQFLEMRRQALLKAGFGKAAVDATVKLRQQQIAARKKVMDDARRAKLVAFAQRVKQYEARNRQIIERSAVKAAAAPPPRRPAPRPPAQQRASAQAAMAAALAKAPQAQLPAPAGKLTPAQRAAFARAFEAGTKPPAPQARAIVPPAQAAVAQQRMAVATARVEGLKDSITADQRQKLIDALAKAGPADRARLLRELPHAGRVSHIPGTPQYVAGPAPRGAPAPKAAGPDQEMETLTVDPVILRNMRYIPRK